MAAVGSRLAARVAAPMLRIAARTVGGFAWSGPAGIFAVWYVADQWMLISIGQCSRDQGCRRLVVVIDHHVRDGVNDFLATCPPNWLTASAGSVPDPHPFGLDCLRGRSCSVCW